MAEAIYVYAPFYLNTVDNECKLPCDGLTHTTLTENVLAVIKPNCSCFSSFFPFVSHKINIKYT